MSTTLSKGYKKPDTGDGGSTWFPNLEENIELANSHAHNGVDGELINGKNVQGAIDTILSENWSTDIGGSVYSQTVTLPADTIFDNIHITLYDSTGSVIHAEITKLSSTTYSIEVNDNELTLTAVYK